MSYRFPSFTSAQAGDAGEVTVCATPDGPCLTGKGVGGALVVVAAGAAVAYLNAKQRQKAARARAARRRRARTAKPVRFACACR